MLEKTGIPTKEQVDSVFPTEDRLAEGPVAVIECFQTIPCNPCEHSCNRGAILPFEDINDRPLVDDSKCNGCGLCIIKCPGLAIMVIDLTIPGGKALVKLPYEFSPLPERGAVVTALDRAGEPIGEAEVVNILVPANKTSIVTLKIDRSLVRDVRNFKIVESDSSIVCRCSDLDAATIREYINKGYTTIDELKRILRLGMGPCQGRTCIPLVIRTLSHVLGTPMASIDPGVFRPVVRSMPLGDIAEFGIINDSN